MKNKEFYENYWRRKGGALPETDPTIKDRKRRLGQFLFSLKNGAKVLDAGCGSGEFSEYIKGLGFEIVGIDISQTAIEKAKNRLPESSFYIGSLEEPLPFKTEEFDAIWATDVLEHLFDIHTCLCEFNRILKPQGYLILTVPYHGLVKNLAITLFGFKKHFNPELSHIRFFTRKSLLECLNQAGFEAILWKGIGRICFLYKSFFTVARKVKNPQQKVEIIG